MFRDVSVYVFIGEAGGRRTEPHHSALSIAVAFFNPVEKKSYEFPAEPLELPTHLFSALLKKKGEIIFQDGYPPLFICTMRIAAAVRDQSHLNYPKSSQLPPPTTCPKDSAQCSSNDVKPVSTFIFALLSE
ncbi:unnamed protein product [Pleuronectes platessa]|uniref:Uncharacterized protein n=1 Tax=Pleuronectes platessa TaxID=8262 RepID=A0A9N7YCT0_PLEPL|nr:unnamed protein product [Pleuronectes platessa]